MLCIPSIAMSAVIFQDNFNSTPSWNIDGSANGECGPPCATAPTGFQATRSIPGKGFTTPPGRIIPLPDSLPDHTTDTTSGKAYVVTNESDPTQNWPGDSILAKYFQQDYKELYVSVWIRTQPGFKWAGVTGDGAVSMAKLLRVQHYDRTGNFFQFFSSGNTAPVHLWEWYYSTKYGNRIHTAYRCDPQSTDYYCSDMKSVGNGGGDEDYLIPGTGKPSDGWTPTSKGMIADGQWHRMYVHVKLNSAPGVADGIMEEYWDADPTTETPTSVDTSHANVSLYTYPNGGWGEKHVNVSWVSANAPNTDVGWNVVAIGGNSHNSFAGPAPATGEQWYAFDDLVVSTTPIPSDYVIGSSSSGSDTSSTTGPTTVAPPSDLKIIEQK